MSPIEQIIGACVDDERMLAHGRTLDPKRRAALARLGQRRMVFIDQLTAASRTLHKSPRARASWQGTLRGLALDLRAFAGGSNSGDVVRACRQSQDRLEARFATALTGSWSREVLQLLTAQHGEIRDSRSVLTAALF